MAIKVKPLNYCPEPGAWATELEADRIAPRWLAHLEQCARCRKTLEDLAAGPELWIEAQETLADRPVDLTHITAAIVPLSLEPSRSASDPMCSYELAQLQKLLPTNSNASTVNASISSSPPCEPIARIGRYDLEQLIGRGGMGLVFRAWDSQLHRVVAVKTLSMTLWALPAARERFIREGRAAAMLSHANIVPMYDVINDPPVPALVMQYIAGPTLDEWINSHGPLKWSHVLRIGLQLADALCAAHEEGLVHRDIKPGNVLLEADGTRALLTDFGLVRAMDDVTLTQSGLLAGTPHYMSPEQARGDETDGRSDLFSLGSLMYFAACGQTPFRGRESMSVLNSLCHSTHTPLNQINAEIPLEVSRLVDRLLQKKPDHRPASSQEVRESIRKLLAAEQRLKPRSKERSMVRTLLAGGGLLIAATAACLCLFADRLLIPNHAQEFFTHSSVPGKIRSSATSVAPIPWTDMTSLSAYADSANASPALATELEQLAAHIDTLESEIEQYQHSMDIPSLDIDDLSLAILQTEREMNQVRTEWLLFENSNPSTKDTLPEPGPTLQSSQGK